jgi:hypothetical protein
LPHWYAAQRALGLRVRALYSTKDTFVTTALDAGVKIAWLETQTGVNYLTLRRHYGKWMPSDGGRELERFAPLDPTLFGGKIVPDPEPIVPGAKRSKRETWEKEMRKGGLEPPRVFSPQDPECTGVAVWSRASRENIGPSLAGATLQRLEQWRSGHDRSRRSCVRRWQRSAECTGSPALSFCSRVSRASIEIRLSARRSEGL